MSLHGGDWDSRYTEIEFRVQLQAAFGAGRQAQACTLSLPPVASWAAPAAAPLSHLSTFGLKLLPLLGG